MRRGSGGGKSSGPTGHTAATAAIDAAAALALQLAEAPAEGADPGGEGEEQGEGERGRRGVALAECWGQWAPGLLVDVGKWRALMHARQAEQRQWLAAGSAAPAAGGGEQATAPEALLAVTGFGIMVCCPAPKQPPAHPDCTLTQ